MTRKIFRRAENILMRDKYNDKAQVDIIKRELEKFLSDYIDFDPEHLTVDTSLTDGMTLTVTVKVKNFKQVGAIRER